MSTLKAGDLTWNKNGDAVIRRQHPVSLEIRNNDSANLSVTAKNQVYLVGTENSKFNFSKFEHDTNSNVRLMTGNGIFTNGSTTINAKDLIAYGGKGNVGEKNNPLKVNLAGSLDANSGDSVYVSSVGDNKLTIQAVAVNNDVSLQSKKDMVMTTETGKTGGYILGKNIYLDAGNADYESILNEISELEKNVNEMLDSVEALNFADDYIRKVEEMRSKLTYLYQKIESKPVTVGAVNDGIRIYSNAPQFSSAPHVSVKSGGVTINNIGNGYLYFDEITAPLGFGLKDTSRVGYKDYTLKSLANEFYQVYRKGWSSIKKG